MFQLENMVTTFCVLENEKPRWRASGVVKT
jgi:hypothetical protein